MIFTNLEKNVYSKKCLKQRRQPPPLPPAKSKVFSRRKSHLPLSLKTIGSAGYTNQWNKRFGWVQVKWLLSHTYEETEEQQPCMEEGQVQIFFLIVTIISFLRRRKSSVG